MLNSSKNYDIRTDFFVSFQSVLQLLGRRPDMWLLNKLLNKLSCTLSGAHTYKHNGI
jgi:hypothetical protein